MRQGRGGIAGNLSGGTRATYAAALDDVERSRPSRGYERKKIPPGLRKKSGMIHSERQNTRKERERTLLNLITPRKTK